MESKNEFSAHKYQCGNCNLVQAAPMHCGRSMVIDTTNNPSNWVCWKGYHPPCCSKLESQPLEQCCSEQDLKKVFIDLM